MFALVATLCGYAQTWQSVPSNGVAKKAISHVNKSTIAPTGDEVWWGYFNENDYNGKTVKYDDFEKHAKISQTGPARKYFS